MAIVYRYIDLIDYIIKYIGISQDYNGFKGRVRDHYGQWWGKLSTYRIEYTEVATINDANCLEGHLIAYYETYKYFNKSKKKWGKCSWISDEDSIVWKEYIPDFKNTKVGNYTGNEDRYDDRGRKLNRNEF